MSASQSLNVLYTGAFRFPDKDAAAFRVYSVAQLLKAQGHSVSFAGWEAGTTPYDYRGHDCYPQGEFRERETNVFMRVCGFFLRGWRTLSWLRANDRFDLVVAYNPPALFSLALLLLGRARHFSVALDSTEWYDSSHLPGGKYGPAAIENWLRMNVCYLFFRNVIAISGFLEQKFRKVNVVRIPPLWLSDEEHTAGRNIVDVIKVMYAGDAGKKDKLVPFIEKMAEVERITSRRVELHVAGIDDASLDRILKNASFDSVKRPTIICYGRLSRAEVIDLYRLCHFSILFREDARYAWAGFPTKAMESWSMGVPIITNAIGDVAKLARHLENAIVVDEFASPESLAHAVNEIIESGLYPSMVENSLEIARQYFSPDAYGPSMQGFVQRM
jgi:glycosyltransferase involved in cell wall biosynthesis